MKTLEVRLRFAPDDERVVGRLMDRYLRGEGLEPESLTPLDRLEFLGSRTMGALTYHPPASTSEGDAVLDLRRMAEASREVLARIARAHRRL